jgi:hypothetical protein
VHCGPGGIFMSNLGGADGANGPGGVALIDHDTFEVTGAWETDRGEQHFAYDVWWHLNEDVAITSEWATPSMIEDGLDPEHLLVVRPEQVGSADRGLVAESRVSPSMVVVPEPAVKGGGAFLA